MARTIPNGSVEIQCGLYLHEYQKTINGQTYTLRDLYAGDGWLFWNRAQPENYRRNRYHPVKLMPPHERHYLTFAKLSIEQSTWSHERINAQFGVVDAVTYMPTEYEEYEDDEDDEEE